VLITVRGVGCEKRALLWCIIPPTGGMEYKLFYGMGKLVISACYINLISPDFASDAASTQLIFSICMLSPGYHDLDPPREADRPSFNRPHSWLWWSPACRAVHDIAVPILLLPLLWLAAGQGRPCRHCSDTEPRREWWCTTATKPWRL
jgi:hypothetical protein